MVPVSLFAFSLLIVTGASAAEKGGDCLLNIFVYHLKEAETVRYCEGDRVLPEGMRRIERLFRSRDSSVTHPVDPRLVRLIDRIEDHFGVRQVEIISGYRSQAFNKELKATGHTVAGESLHTRGMAADIHLDEITEEDLRDYALSLGGGGVGFYPSLNMVHVDIGPVRTWGEPAPRKGWVGEKNEEIPLLITVTPDLSRSKRLQSVRIDYPKEGLVAYEVGVMEVQFFDRNRWEGTGVQIGGAGACQTTIPISPRVISLERLELSQLPYGKYRLRARVCGMDETFQYSNEFYFKRR